MSDTRSLFRQVMDTPAIDLADIHRKVKEDMANGKTALEFMEEFAAACPATIPETTYYFPPEFFKKP